MNSLVDNRTIRVFISSTFQDMKDERTELIRRTFPRLREMAAQRDVTLTEVDLRWGITKEESESGKVMEVCLREVENSIPFFIGIIGNRYGWIPKQKDISDIVKERFPHVPNYVERHLSATEIEMQFGVLDRTDIDMNAYFFIKEEETFDIDDPERLAALKKAVRENKKYPVSTYKDPEDLAGQVLAAFTKLLDDLFPVGELSALEKERLGQRTVLNNLSRVYIKTESNFAVIDEWMEDWEKHQLVITGASGLGKSALVANWIKEKLKIGEELPCRIIYHFVGYGGSVGSDWHVVKALCDEIRDRYGFEADEREPKTDEKALDDLFKRVAFEEDKPLLIVLDGINQIIDVNYAKRLNWLPIPPRKVKILFTTLEDDGTMEVFRGRHYPIFTLQPLTREERIAMVRRYLDTTYRKHLEDVQLERIVDDPQNVNTLVLKTLLDEIANFGSFEQLDEKIEEYLKPDSISDFYQVVLQNYEADFGEELVRHFLSLIAVSRNGLSEDEILEITDTKDKPILWSQFFCSFRQHMVVKNGLVSFAHSYIREAVEERYIKDHEDWVKTCREEIVSVLENQMTPKGKKTIRSMDEVPYQFELWGEIVRLYCYINTDVMVYYLRNNELELGRYWQEIIANNINFDLLIYLKDIEGDFNLLTIFSTFIAQYTNHTCYALAYLQKAHTILKDKDKAFFFHTLGDVYTAKANQCYRKELHILASTGRRVSLEFADALISVARTNDLVSRPINYEINDKKELVEIKKRIEKAELLERRRQFADKQKTQRDLGIDLFKEYENVPEYHFDFEDRFWGNELQMAYVNEAIGIVNQFNYGGRYKIASYYSYIFDIVFFPENLLDYLSMLDEALHYFIWLNTRRSIEVIRILKQKTKILVHELLTPGKSSILKGNDAYDISNTDIDNIYNELIDCTISLYGKYSLQLADIYYEYSDFCDAIFDFNKELYCYERICQIYSKWGMKEEMRDAQTVIEKYLRKRTCT